MTDSNASHHGLPPPSRQTGALSHLRVLDLSRVLAGPWCTQNLADMGADVIKIEKPGAGDDTRHWGPPYLHGDDGPTPQASYFAACNRNKRSVTLDIATAAGQQLVRELAMQSDVVIENYKTGGLKRYGLDYDTLSALNPRLVYCSITGFGQTGPYAARPGYDLLVQAMSGLMSITGQPDGEPGAGPLRVGVAVIDVFTGMYATTAILGAIEARHHTGVGQHIDIALLDVAMAVLANQGAGYLNAGVVPTRQGNVHPSVVPYQDFPTRDGNMLLAIGNDGQFARFCEVADVDWARDERYATNSSRVTHRKALIAMMCDVTRRKTTSEWVRLLEAATVPCGPINDIAQAFADEQVQHRALRVEQQRYAPGERPATDPVDRIRTTASPLRMSGTPTTLRHAPPALGQHTDEVLRDCLGLDAARIAELRASGALGAA